MSRRWALLRLAAALIVSALVLTVLSVPIGPLPPLGKLLDPRGGFWTTAEDAFPPGDQTLSFPGLTQPVAVFRDGHGIPHVFAQDDMDLFRAMGYLQATERLFQMDAQRRFAKGTLAEVMGPSMADTDRFMRTIGIMWGAENTLAELDSETLAFLQAFSDGVNTHIGEVSPLDLPLEFKLLDYRPAPWEPLDTLAFIKYMGWLLSVGFAEDLELKLFQDAYGPQATEELFPLKRPFALPIVPPGSSGAPQPSPASEGTSPSRGVSQSTLEGILSQYSSILPLFRQFEFRGSNNWVINASKSTTGAPILANDPHLDLTLPSVWYQLRLSSPSFNVYGVSLVGVPLVVLGFNEHIAWGFTSTAADVVDFFVEEVNPEDEMQYLHRGQWKDFDVRQEVMQVKGGSSVTFDVKTSVHGPVISDLAEGARFNETMTMQWTGHRATFEVRAGLNFTQASNWIEYRTALEDFHVPAQNMVYADVEGNIGMVVNGLYPIRGRGFGRIPADGSSGDYDWTGFVPFDEIPAAYNPSQGFLVSANQIPSVDTPHHLGWVFADRYRAARINEVLNGSESFSVDDMKVLQQDHVSVAAREFIPFLLDAFDALADGGMSLHPKALGAIALLEAWDYDMDAQEVAPTIYFRWLFAYREATFRDEWDAEALEEVGLPQMTILENMTKFDPSSSWFDDVSTPEVEDRDEIVRQAFVTALTDLETEIGFEMQDWVWGDFQVLQLLHLSQLEPLSSETLPRPGGPFTVDVAGGSLSDGRLLVTHGPSWRMVIDFSAATVTGVPVGFGVYPGGQSGRPLSPRYQDFLELWMDGEYLELYLTEEADFQATSSPRG